MALNVRFEGEVAILSNVARTMNDPRYHDAEADLRALLDQGYRRFVVELRGIRDTGSTLIGLLITLTRQARRDRGEVVLAGPSKAMAESIRTMQLDDFWDVFDTVEEARAFFRPRTPDHPAED